MGEKTWLDELDSENRIRVQFVTERGQVTQILVVQYEALIDDRWRPVVRYDNAHGFLHRDVLAMRGKQEKIAIPSDDLAAALTTAIKDIKRRWPYYRQRFEEGLL